MLTTLFLLQGKPDWKKFRKALPAYLPEMDKMFAGVAVDGSSSFVPGQPDPIEVQETSDDEASEDADDAQTDDIDEPFSPASVRTKRASSTSTIASSPKKRCRSPAVRSMDNNMRQLVNIAQGKLHLMDKIWEEKRDALMEVQTARETAKDRKVEKVYQLATEAGVTPTSEPVLFTAIMDLIKCDRTMTLFIATNDAGRLLMLKKIAGVNN